MKKYIAPVVTFLVLIIIAAGLFYVVNMKPQTQPVVDNQPTAANITPEIKSYSENDKEVNYKADIKYPEFSGFANADAQAKVNADIKASVFASLADFKKDLNCTTPDDDQAGNPCVFSAEFGTPVTVDGKILSVPMQNYYYTQGAHGSTILTFANYDVATGEKINFKNLFNGDYLKVIAAYSKGELTKKITVGENAMSDIGWVARGTDATVSENYDGNIGFDNNGLIAIFQQYQVAAYAAGPQTVHIPYAILKDAIDPNGPLSQWAAKAE